MRKLSFAAVFGVVIAMNSVSHADVVSASITNNFGTSSAITEDLDVVSGTDPDQVKVADWAVYNNTDNTPQNTQNGGPSTFGNVTVSAGNGDTVGQSAPDGWSFLFDDPANSDPQSGENYGFTIDWNFGITGATASLQTSVTPNIEIGKSGRVRLFGEVDADAGGQDAFGGDIDSAINISGMANSGAGSVSWTVPQNDVRDTWMYEVIFDDYQGETLTMTFSASNWGGGDPESVIASIQVAEVVPEPSTGIVSLLALCGVAFARRRRK